MFRSSVRLAVLLALCGVAQAQTNTLAQPIHLHDTLQVVQPAVFNLASDQFENRIGMISPEVMQRKLLLLGYQPLTPVVFTQKMALGKFQLTKVAPSYLQTLQVQKDGLKFSIEIDPFTGLIKELK